MKLDKDKNETKCGNLTVTLYSQGVRRREHLRAREGKEKGHLRAREAEEHVQGVRPDRDDGQGREPLVLRRLHAKCELETEARRGDPLRDLRSDQQAATRRDTPAREARTGDRRLQPGFTKVLHIIIIF